MKKKERKKERMVFVTSPIDIVCLFNVICVVVEVKYHVVYLHYVHGTTSAQQNICFLSHCKAHY